MTEENTHRLWEQIGSTSPRLLAEGSDADLLLQFDARLVERYGDEHIEQYLNDDDYILWIAPKNGEHWAFGRGGEGGARSR